MYHYILGRAQIRTKDWAMDEITYTFMREKVVDGGSPMVRCNDWRGHVEDLSECPTDVVCGTASAHVDLKDCKWAIPRCAKEVAKNEPEIFTESGELTHEGIWDICVSDEKLNAFVNDDQKGEELADVASTNPPTLKIFHKCVQENTGNQKRASHKFSFNAIGHGNSVVESLDTANNLRGKGTQHTRS